MATKILIDGIEVALHSSGATAILYKHEFKRDFFKDFAYFEKYAIQEANGEEIEDDQGEALDVLIRTAYIMAKQVHRLEDATGRKPFPDFLAWCDQFSLIGLAADIPQVAPIIVADRQTTEEAKKKNEPSA